MLQWPGDIVHCIQDLRAPDLAFVRKGEFEGTFMHGVDFIACLTDL